MFIAQPALPAEQQNPVTNPGGGALGWVIVDDDDNMVNFPGFTDKDTAEEWADKLNRREFVTDINPVLLNAMMAELQIHFAHELPAFQLQNAVRAGWTRFINRPQG